MKKKSWVNPSIQYAAAAAAKSLQSCPTLCDPMECSLPGFSVHGILQARTLEWVAISFSNAWKWKLKVKLLSRVRLLATPWTAAYQAPPSTGNSTGVGCHCLLLLLASKEKASVICLFVCLFSVIHICDCFCLKKIKK